MGKVIKLLAVLALFTGMNTAIKKEFLRSDEVSTLFTEAEQIINDGEVFNFMDEDMEDYGLDIESTKGFYMFFINTYKRWVE